MGVMAYHRHSARVIRSRRWPPLRLAAKRRDGWRCIECASHGRLEIDHIKPVRTHPELAFELSNLQTLCPRCHARKTAIETGIAPLDPQRQRWRDLLAQRCAGFPLDGEQPHVRKCEDHPAPV
jgi:5-methylcytosine-specific restriction protein A